MSTESDRELLELAAKAAWIELRWHPDGTAYSDSRCKDYWGVWNPLTDDGDALRLAVKLNLRIGPASNLTNGPTLVQAATNTGAWDKGPMFFNEVVRDDPYAATRRAIVRAAAEIRRTL